MEKKRPKKEKKKRKKGWKPCVECDLLIHARQLVDVSTRQHHRRGCFYGNSWQGECSAFGDVKDGRHERCQVIWMPLFLRGSFSFDARVEFNYRPGVWGVGT